MNVKKTIASIAAIAMVASATSLAPLFTGTSIAADELTDVAADDITPADGEVDGDVTETTDDEITEANDAEDYGIMPLSVADTDHSGHTTANTVDGISGADGTVTNDGNTFTVTLKQTSEANIEGTAHGDVDQYHVIIPVQGIGEGWSFRSGYGWDDEGNHSYNIGDNLLRLWLPITAKEDGYTIVLQKDGSDDITIVVKTVVVPYVAEEENTLTVGNSGTVDSVTGGSGSVSVTGTNVTVTLTPTAEGGTIGGAPENGDDDGTENYHVVIPVTGLDSSWTFDVSSQYQYDNSTDASTKAWNIDEGTLKLWLPIESGTCNVVLVKGGTKVTIKVTTVNGSTAVTPPDDDPVVDPTEPTDLEKLTTVNSSINSILETDDFTWVNVSDLEVWAADGIVADIKNKVKLACDVDADMTLLEYFVDENGGVTMRIKVQVGGAEDIKLIWVQCTDDRAPVIPDTPAPVVPYYPPVVSNNPVNPSAGTVTEVTSAVQISASKQKEVTVNAAEADVTPAMVRAFVKNKNTKTLTLKYSSALKVSIDKANISSVSADLDFSVSGKKFLSTNTISKSKSLKNASKIVQLDFVNKGELEGVDKVTIKSRVGADYIGKTVTIYEYKNGKLIKIGTATVNGAGIVKFNTNYLGQFVLAVE